jgi:hypothetical protein
MHFVSSKGSPTVLEEGALAGNFHARVTLQLSSAEYSKSAFEPTFTIVTSHGTMAGLAYLGKYVREGAIVKVKYRGTVTNGSGAFAHAHSSNLRFVGYSNTGSSVGPGAKAVITMTGALFY